MNCSFWPAVADFQIVNINLIKINKISSFFIINSHSVSQNFSSLRNVIQKFFQFTQRKTEKFSVYKMETRKFVVYGIT